MRILQSLCLCSASIATLTVATAASAADNQRLAPPAVAPLGTDAAVRAYWTPERMLAAKPLDKVVSGVPSRAHHAPTGKVQIFPGAPPRINDYDSSLEIKLYDPALKGGGTRPPLVGTSGQPYTTNRFFPQNDKKLEKIYPYATIGQLFFTINGSGYVCTASVIRWSTIATAGHCVNDGNGNYYTNWLFVPAENGGKGPYGSWTWANADTTTAWYFGGGGVPNEQDDAVIILNQQTYKHHLHSIGDLTGDLGYEFNAPAPIAVTQVGYPCNLDSCSDPIATYAQNHVAGTNNYEWGTAQAGGSSGGPQLQDFGQAPTGIPTETLGGNILVSSTSYVYNDSNYQVEGGSILYSPGQNGEWTFGDLINWACGAGGC
ncbi:MAG TPA: hypothetical protein VGM17_06430 [Rhizomicrobium sp.]|jgi:V8-like Glu-specific endopeptidase